MCSECEEIKDYKSTLSGQTKVCKCCGVEKPIEEFQNNGLNKNGNIKYKATCKVCGWFERRKDLIILDNWNKQEYEIIIDCLLNHKVNCLNDIEERLEYKSFENLIDLINILKLQSVKLNIKYTCDNCGSLENYSKLSQYTSTQNHFCSKKCFDEWQSTSLISNCDFCNKEVLVSKLKFENNEHIFCCFEHSVLYRVENSNENRKCIECGEDFECKKISSKKFCSKECYDNWQRKNAKIGVENPKFTSILTTCDWCGREYYITPSRLNNEKQQSYFCSTDCRMEWYALDYSQRPEVKELCRKNTLKMLEDGVIPNTRTKPHLAINNILDELKIKYTNEKAYKYHSIDLVLEDNMLIEIMGGFWHCDNRKYNVVNYELQMNNIIRDKQKYSYFKNKYDREILYLWEDDINSNEVLCKQLILEYINNKGQLKDYNSFNYSLKNNVLVENDDVIIPYMKWDIDDLNKIVDLSVKEARSQKQLDKWVEYKCDFCGKDCEEQLSSYSSSEHHFCSSSCHNKWQRLNSGTVSKICVHCGKKINVIKSKIDASKSNDFYCSKECYNKHIEKELISVICKNCKHEFLISKCKYDKSKNKIFYCNRECYNNDKSNKVTFNCDYCNKEKTIKNSAYVASKNRLHFCSKHCHNKYKIEHNKILDKTLS